VARVHLIRTAREALGALGFLHADAALNTLGELELELERDPHLGHQLRGRLTGLRSYRVGIYRSIYELRDGKTVRVIAIRHQSSAYVIDPR
jgi:mRNA interferase RelE/StbE